MKLTTCLYYSIAIVAICSLENRLPTTIIMFNFVEKIKYGRLNPDLDLKTENYYNWMSLYDI